MVELLLQYGANINASDRKGQTPLHYCAINGKSSIAKVLIMRCVFVYLASISHNYFFYMIFFLSFFLNSLLFITLYELGTS